MTDAKSQIAFQQVGLAGVLKQYRLRVPSNQREYSWQERQVVTLFTDISRAISEGEADYFLGTIVTIPRADGVLEVVDGQQRLATTTMLLAQMKNYLASIGEDILRESIDHTFLSEIDREKRQRVLKLQLNLDDNEFFRNLILAAENEPPKPTRDSHKLLLDTWKFAQKQIRDIVAAYDKKDHGDVINQWLRFIEDRAQVILLRVPSDVNAYKMFETLNDRGLKTSQSDLVKNYLFGQSAERLEEAQVRWAQILAAIDSLDDETVSTVSFLRHALIVLKGPLRETEVYEQVQTIAKGSHLSLAFLNNVSRLASTYIATFNPEGEMWATYPDAIRKAIRVLNLLNNKPSRPLLLAIADKFSPNEAAKAFKLAVSWHVRFLITGITRTGGSVEVPLAAAAKKVFASEITDAKTLSRELTTVIPTDDQFERAFEVATVSKAALARYYLRSLEMAHSGESEPGFIPNDEREIVNLEHILPIDPQSNWPTWSPEDHGLHVRRIGNLALMQVRQNSDLRSSDFATKRIAYQSAPYALTQQIGAETEWTKQLITRRQRTLARLALKAWPI